MATNGSGVQDPTQAAGGAQAVTNPANDYKGKGKAVAAEDDDMKDVHDEEEDEEEEDEDEDEDGAENDDDDEDGDDDLRQQGINLDNVIGRRTRGVVIDYAKAAAENPADEEEDEEDDDFEEPDSMDED